MYTEYMKNIFKIIYYGYGILIFAAIINWLGKYLGMKSWYDLFGTLNFRDLSPVNMIWLIVAYPLLLGTGVYILIHKGKIIKFKQIQ